MINSPDTKGIFYQEVKSAWITSRIMLSLTDILQSDERVLLKIPDPNPPIEDKYGIMRTHDKQIGLTFGKNKKEKCMIIWKDSIDQEEIYYSEVYVYHTNEKLWEKDTTGIGVFWEADKTNETYYLNIPVEELYNILNSITR